MVLGIGFGPLAQIKAIELAQNVKDPAHPFAPGKKVLMIGDSHSGMAYGTEMKSRIEGATGTKVSKEHKIGASTAYFTDKVAGYISRDNPDTIVVSLGANFRDASSAGAKVQFERLEKAIRATGSKAQIVWVGPPRTADDMKDGGKALREFDAKMEKAIGGRAKYFSSEAHSSYAGGDKVHYNDKPGRAWANAVFNQIYWAKP